VLSDGHRLDEPLGCFAQEINHWNSLQKYTFFLECNLILHTSFNNHRIFCGANQAQSPHFLLNGKTLRSNESRVAGKKLKEKRFLDLKSRGHTHNQKGLQACHSPLATRHSPLATRHSPLATSHQLPATSSPASHDFAFKRKSRFLHYFKFFRSIKIRTTDADFAAANKNTLQNILFSGATIFLPCFNGLPK
jgi:hypothetical protein